MNCIPHTDELLEKVAQRVEREGIEAWFSLDAADLLGDEANNYKKLPDTLDVWFESGTTHDTVLNTMLSSGIRPTFIWRARTSIAGGSSPRS